MDRGEACRTSEGSVRQFSIPTDYAGVHFRSRLEAKWAAFFDLAKWRWDYEPLDLLGYVPDFLLSFPSGRIAVEVKPIAWDDTDGDAAIIGPARSKLLSWDGDALMLGAFVQDRFAELREGGTWGPAFVFRCLDCGAISFAPEDGSWQCRVSGCYAGKRHIDPSFDRVAAFKAASNTVQWVPR